MSTLELDPRPAVSLRHRTDGVIPLEAITPDDRPNIGARALRLSRATQAGLPVPKGIVLTAATLGCLASGVTSSPTADHLDDVFESLGRNGQMALAVKMSAVGPAGSADTIEAARGITRRCDLLHTVRRLSVTATLLDDTVAVIIQHDIDACETGTLFTLPVSQRINPRLDDLARNVVDVFGGHQHLSWAIDQADRLWILDVGERIS